MPTHAEVQAWLDASVAAWRSSDRDAIRALFSDDVSYAYHPYDEPLRGGDAVADSWLENPDERGSWEAEYAPELIGFAPDGRCTRFIEWYVLHPKP